MRKHRSQFGDGGAVAFDLGVGLFERQGGAQREGLQPGECSRQKSGQRQDAFTMNMSGQFDLALDVDDPFVPTYVRAVILVGGRMNSRPVGRRTTC